MVLLQLEERQMSDSQIDEEEIKTKVAEMSAREFKNWFITEYGDNYADTKKAREFAKKLLEIYNEEDVEIDDNTKQIEAILKAYFRNLGTRKALNDYIKGKKQLKDIKIKTDIDMSNFEKNMDLLVVLGIEDKDKIKELIDFTKGIYSGEKEEFVSRDIVSILGTINELDMSLIADRIRFYTYWETVSEQYEKLVSAFDLLLSEAEDLQGNEEFKEHMREIEIPPNYVLEGQEYEIDLPSASERLYVLLVEMGYLENVAELDDMLVVDSTEKVDIVLDYAIREGLMLVAGGYDDELIEEIIDLIEGDIDEDDKEDMKHILQVVETQINPDVWDEWRKFDATLKEDVGTFFVPISPFVMSIAKENRGAKITVSEDIITDTEDFFVGLQKAFTKERALFTLYQPAEDSAGTVSYANVAPTVNQPTSEKNKTQRIDVMRAQPKIPPKAETITGVTDSFKKAHEAFVDVMNLYYFLPLSSSNFLDAPPTFSQTASFKEVDDDIEWDDNKWEGKGKTPAHRVKPKGDYSMKNLKEMWGKSLIMSVNGTDIVVNAEQAYKHWKTIEGYIDMTKDKQIIFNKTLYSTIKNTVEALNKIFPKREVLNEAWGGNELWKYSEGLKRKDAEPFMGKTLEEHHNAFEKQDIISGYHPINKLKQVLQDDEFLYIVKVVDELQGSSKMREIEAIIEALTPKKSSGVDDLIKAHDFIRHMTGREIIRGHCRVDRINAMSNVIDFVYDKYKTDVTVREVNDIVKMVDSFKNVAHTHGVSEDVVYAIKGLCR
jgi:hypothetical protein